MISELKIRNFKSLESVDLKLGNFNLLVGANASGKSNFLDALRFLQGIATHLKLEEVLNGKPQTSTSARWSGIRGGSRLVAFRAHDGTVSPAFSFHVTQPTMAGNASLTYTIEASPIAGRIVREEIAIDGGRHWPLAKKPFDLPPTEPDSRVYESTMIPELTTVAKIGHLSSEVERRMAATKNLRATINQQLNESEPNSKSALDPSVKVALKDALSEEKTAEFLVLWDEYMQTFLEMLSRFQIDPSTMTDDDFQTLIAEAERLLGLLGDIQSIDPRPELLRRYSKSGGLSRLDEYGDGLAGLVQKISETPETKDALLEWLKELRPDEIDDLITIKGAVDDFMVAIQEGTNQFPAEVLSDGTLRFIAIAVAFFQPSMPKVLIIEDIEKGFHPSRLRLLLELMRSQSKRTGTQVFATTHSPTLLNWLTEEDRKTTFVCTRDAETGATKMRSLSEVPKLEELIKKNYNLDQLFEEGWLESVLHEP
jgi:energy-coupling factor transporter ATP-binding protein EcfA2